jgi:phosphoribosyl 1,2-cyclic phosphodiesterase
VLVHGIPVYASQGTADALNEGRITPLADRVPVTIGTLDILPFPTFHDAAEPLGFLIRSHEDSDRLVFATDTVNLGYRFPGVTIACIEANFDDTLLSRADRMPASVIERIRNTHMDFNRTLVYLTKMDKRYLREVYLLHLSAAFSSEDAFVGEAQYRLGSGVKVTACPEIAEVV